MSTKFGLHVATRAAPRVSRKASPAIRQTPVRSAIPGREAEMARNASGAMIFKMDCFAALERFLIIGTEGSTYYSKAGDDDKAAEARHTLKVFDNLLQCINEDAIRTVDMIVDVSKKGRAAKNDQALFALAAIMKLAVEPDDRYYARMAVNEVARIGTHILHLAEFVDQLGGWGTGTRKAFQNWFLEKEPDQIAYQAIKYNQRDGWSMRDLLRKAHPWGTEEQNATFDLIAHPENGAKLGGKYPPIMWAAHEVKRDAMVMEAKLSLIKGYDLPREALPTEMLNDTRVWQALLPGMRPGALIRNLGKLSSLGMLEPLSDNAKFVRGVLTNDEELRRARIHPLNVMNARMIYAAGHGLKGSLRWTPNPAIVQALEECFEKSFNFTEPCGKNICIALDVSASMRWETNKIPGTMMYSADAAAIMALVTAKKESNYMVLAFSSGIQQVNITSSDSFSTVLTKLGKIPAGGTNISLPMLDALDKKIPVDCFQVYTDNDTNMGRMKPSEALQLYRRDMGRPNAKLAVVATVATEVSVADPKDAGMMDFVGFDSNAPQAMAAFASM